MKTYADALVDGGYIYFSGFYTNDLSDIKKEANKCGLDFISNLEKNDWGAAVFIKKK